MLRARLRLARPLNVYVVNYPLKYFAERIGGDDVKVTLPVPADVDPVYWTPGIADIGAYQQADLILLNGAGYAKWVSKVSLPRSKTVDTSRGFKDQYITVKETMTHSHGAEGEHAHEGLAFTTWLDLSLAAKQAEAIAECPDPQTAATKRPVHGQLSVVGERPVGARWPDKGDRLFKQYRPDHFFSPCL